MEKNRTDKRLLFFLLMFVLGGVFTLLYFMLLGNTPQTYNDFTVEMTSSFALNKSIEMRLIWMLVFVGCAAYFLYYLKTQQKYAEVSLPTVSEKADESIVIFSAVVTVMITIFVFYGENSSFAELSAVLLLCAAIAGIKDRRSVAGVLVLAFFALYAFLGIYEVYLLAGGMGALNKKLTLCAVFAVTAACTLLPMRLNAVKRMSLILQLFIPFTLLAQIFSKYYFNGGVISVPVPKRAVLLVVIFAGAFVIENIVRLVKKFRRESGLSDIISFGTCAAVMTFDRFSGISPGFVTGDMRHPYENIIGWLRYFERGEVPFGTSIPVSGLFSVVQGAFFKFMGGGKLAYCGLSENLFYMLVIMLVVFLLRKHVKGFYTFVIALVFTITEYNRYTFVLPFALLLLLPEVMKRKDLWLKLWFITSLFMGLYYPLFGAAYCFGFMPLGIWQAVGFVKTGELKKAVKKPMFWITWAVCIIPALLSLKLIIKMLIHIKIMGSQTLLADGMERFAQTPLKTWMSYLPETNFVRLALYDIFTFLLPAALVWLVFALALKLGKAESTEKSVRFGDVKGLCIGLSAVIFMLVSFTSTFVRMDFFTVFTRSDGVLMTVCIMLIVLAHKYMKNNRLKYMVCCAAFVFPCLSDHILINNYFTEVGFANALSRHSNIYDISDEYVYIDDKEDTKLYNSFIKNELYESIKKYRKQSEKYDKNKIYTMVYPNYMHYYINDIKTASLMESTTAKDLSTSKEAAEYALKNNAVIGREIDPVSNYYLLNWIYTSGAYVWSEKDGGFVSNTSGLSREDVIAANKAAGGEKNVLVSVYTASALGNSMDTLMGVFEKKDIPMTFSASENGIGVNFAQPVLGDDADFMYIELSGGGDDISYGLTAADDGIYVKMYDKTSIEKYLMKKVENKDKTVFVQWIGEDGETHDVQCSMCSGKLLLPLGANTDWLLNAHSGVEIRIDDTAAESTMLDIKDIYFLKLREI